MTVSREIEAILARSRMARNSDKALFVDYMQAKGMNLSQQQIERFMRLPSLESIRRTRQKLQESGKYPADQKVKHERGWKAMRMQQSMPSAKPEAIERIVLPFGEG